MVSDFSKPPTDAATIKAFNGFEAAFNVADALLRLTPERAYATKEEAGAARDTLIAAQRVMHNLASRADERMALKKAAKAGATDE